MIRELRLRILEQRAKIIISAAGACAHSSFHLGSDGAEPLIKSDCTFF